MMQHKGMPHIVLQHAASEGVVELGTLPYMLLKEFSIGSCVGSRVEANPLFQPATYCQSEASIVARPIRY